VANPSFYAQAARRSRRDRRLVLVDVENVVAGACLTAELSEWARELITAAVELRPTDQVVIGTSHHGLLHVACGWPDVRYVVRSGSDGADLALLRVLDEQVAKRFDQVVVVSGDRIFAEAVRGLAAQGVAVTVAAFACCLSAALREAAPCVRLLPGDRPERLPW
jgi:hypothetical protein